METYKTLSTGIPALDEIMQMVMPGDNLVWQVDSIDEYRPFAEAFASNVLTTRGELVYFRFADHPEILSERPGLTVHHLNPDVGFETFTAEIRMVIRDAGRGSAFVFDCLSDLPVHWYSDLMLGNFFVLICPYVYYLNSLAYFALFRYRHSLSVASRIRNTTQILIDTYRYQGDLYIHPLKVDLRHSPTMYLPHKCSDGKFVPVTDSATVSEMVNTVMGTAGDSASRTIDVWDRTFIEAASTAVEIDRGDRTSEEARPVFDKLLRMLVSRDDRVLGLAQQHFTIRDLLDIRKRLIGTGFIGGKSVGMLLSRAILKKSDQRWNRLLEVHDSFFVGSDVFYTYTVMNGCWDMRQKQRDTDTFLEDIDTARHRILSGEFPEFILDQFVEMFDYFGQSPIIVRSSSLLEDNFGNAFSGKYESVFCVNQGTRRERFDVFLDAIRRVYASSMSKEALMYRARRGLLDRDEQMALLIQRVSGAVYGNHFFPQIAGVGLSFNPYAWSDKIDPGSGMLRIVCGLGTRAVDRHDDDYTRVVALNAPTLRPESRFDRTVGSAQTYVDAIDLHENRFCSPQFNEISRILPNYALDIVGTRLVSGGDRQTGNESPSSDIWAVTFEKLFSDTPFVRDMREMLRVLQDAYDYPVDIEFTANFRRDGSYQINLLQCRPLQIGGLGMITEPPENIPREDVILETGGAVIGPGRVTTVDRIIYVVPSQYGRMPEHDRYAVARLIGRLTHVDRDDQKVIMLMGPGRWGTSMASLGVPVKFADINTVSIICEIVEMNENLVPDVSLGTHFFNDIVETQMLYIAVFPNLETNEINRRFLEESKNMLPELLPSEVRWADAVRVIDPEGTPVAGKVVMHADTVHQRVLCYLDRRTGKSLT